MAQLLSIIETTPATLHSFGAALVRRESDGRYLVIYGDAAHEAAYPGTVNGSEPHSAEVRGAYAQIERAIAGSRSRKTERDLLNRAAQLNGAAPGFVDTDDDCWS